MEYITCIDNSSVMYPRSGVPLTVGKVYKILTTDGADSVQVTDDAGELRWYYRRRFKSVELGRYYHIEMKINAIKTRRESLGYRW